MNGAAATSEAHLAARTHQSDTSVASLIARPAEPVRALPLDQQWRLSDEIAQAFLLGFGKATTECYQRDLRAFTRHCEELGVSPLAASRRDIELYARVMENRQGLAASTRSRRLSTLAGFFTYAVDEDALSRTPMRRVRRPRVPSSSQKLGLDRDEAILLIAGAQAHSPRAHLLVTALIYQGLRITELLAADVTDLTVVNGHRVLRVHRKGGNTQSVPLAGPVLETLDCYLQGRRDGPLLLSRTGRRLDRTNAGRLVKRLAADALPNRPDISPHAARHAFVALALDAGVSLDEVRAGAGHAAATTTLRYANERRALQSHPAHRLADYLGPHHPQGV